jgi:hypothetical protein
LGCVSVVVLLLRLRAEYHLPLLGLAIIVLTQPQYSEKTLVFYAGTDSRVDPRNDIVRARRHDRHTVQLGAEHNIFPSLALWRYARYLASTRFTFQAGEDGYVHENVQWIRCPFGRDGAWRKHSRDRCFAQSNMHVLGTAGMLVVLDAEIVIAKPIAATKQGIMNPRSGVF